jgi:16S rRNA (adenine1518-N6/adenine1519-N6)-dimethyltransferase
MDLPFAKKGLGQHWLHDPASLRAMCDAASVGADDTVLEIGPGLGTLTAELVERAGKVIAVEFDAQLAQELPGRVAASNLEIVRQDILRFDFSDLPAGYKIVANIPYYLSSNLLRVLSEAANPPAVAALLVQKEVAERAAAQPGGMSLLSVTLQWYWEVSVGADVPAKLFTPPPKVDSQILILHRRAQPLFPDVDTRTFFRVVKAGFAQRRKTLLNSLSSGLHLSRDQTIAVLQASSIDPQARAQSLSLAQWHQLYLQLRPLSR